MPPKKKDYSRLEMLIEVLGYPRVRKGNEHIWACQFCKSEEGDPGDDNFLYNEVNGKYSCFADSNHTRKISNLVRKRFYETPENRERKLNKEPVIIPISEAPQEILDYWAERKISLTTLEYFKVRYDKANQQLVIPTHLFRDKYKPLFCEQRGKWSKGKNLSENTAYPVHKDIKKQKKFLYLEGIPDIWAIYSNFPKEFFDEYYVTATVHGATHIPTLWEDKNYWENFHEIILCGDNDKAGEAAVIKLKSLIGGKTRIITLPFRHQRIVNGEMIYYTSKDFNDALIEGMTYEDFQRLINNQTIEDLEIEQAIEEIKKSSNKLQIVIDDVHKLGVVEEDMIIAIVFLTCLSYKFDTCLGVVLKGRFASGKSVIVKTITKLFPPERVLPISSFSKQALQYMFDLSHKILFQTEEPPADDPAYWELYSSFRQLISEGEITRATVEKDPKTNKMETKLNIVKGPAPYISTTTQAAIHEENESRLIALQTNDTPIHITQVKDMLDKKAMGKWTKKSEQEFIIKKWRRYIDQLPMWELDAIEVSFADQLDMKIYGSDMIRDYDKLLKLMKILAFLESDGGRCAEVCEGVHLVCKTATSAVHAGITPKEGQLFGKSGETPQIIKTLPQHYKYIYELTKDFFNSKATRISQVTYRYFERVKKAFQSRIWAIKEVAITLNLDRSRVQHLVADWRREDMIKQTEEKGPHGANLYQVNEDWEVIDAELTPPEHINKEVQVNGQVRMELPSSNIIDDIPDELKAIFSISKPPEEEEEWKRG